MGGVCEDVHRVCLGGVNLAVLAMLGFEGDDRLRGRAGTDVPNELLELGLTAAWRRHFKGVALNLTEEEIEIGTLLGLAAAA